MSSPLPSDRPAPDAVVFAHDAATTLAALGAAFDDVVVGALDEVRDELAAIPADVVVVLDGPVPAEVTESVVRHVATSPGSRLALGVSRELTALDGEQYAGLRIVGGGRIGDLPVTWWAAADAPAAAAVPPVALAPERETADPYDAFVAHTHRLRAQLELAGATEDRAGEAPASATSVPAASSPAAPVPAAAPSAAPAPAAAPPRMSEERRTTLGYRVPLMGVLLVVGIALGISAEELWSGHVETAATLLVLGATCLLLTWGVRALRGLTGELQGHAEHTARRLEELDRGMRQLIKRTQTVEIRTGRIRETLRDVEARLAVVSSASANFGRPRPQAADPAPDRPDGQ